MNREYRNSQPTPEERRNQRLTVDDMEPVGSILQVAERSPDWKSHQLRLKEEQANKSISGSNKKKSSGVLPIALSFGLVIGVLHIFCQAQNLEGH